MHTITRRLEFDAAHRVHLHESKCNHIHGHRYVVEVECTGSLDKLGRIVDFSVIKTKFGQWIDKNLDHGMILFKDDPLAELWPWFGQKLATNAAPYPVAHLTKDSGPQKHFIMRKNPTAENLAELLYNKARDLLVEDGFAVTKMTVWETPNCRATYSE
tara:strand:+ start:3103 stop:3576 length:474 start_codon:yes stop_codon:yes gene_type:complete